MSETRSELRTSQRSPVRVFGLNSEGKLVNQTGWTVDVSRCGARLRGLPCWTGPGEIIGVRCGTEKARFKVVWVGQPGTPREGEVGLRCLEAGRYIWGIAPPVSESRPIAAAPAARMTPPLASAGPSGGEAHNRRRDARYRPSGGAKVQELGSPAGQWTMLHDISVSGCYVETTSPLSPGTRVKTEVHIGDMQIAAHGEITVSHRLVGMGVRFTDMTALNRQRLEWVVDQLVESGALEA